MSQSTEPVAPVLSLENVDIDAKPPTKSIRRERSEARWESHKEEIQQLYVEQGMSLKGVMQFLESKHSFKFSLRSWRAKMKEWNFEKNLPANEMAFIAAKVDKRKFEEGKDTIFFRGNIKIEAERIENFKKRKLTVTDMVNLPILVDTPGNMTYHTPAAAPEPDGTGAVSISEMPAESMLVVHGELSEQRAFGTAIGDPDAAIVTPNSLSPAQFEVDENQRPAGSTSLFTPSQSSGQEIKEAAAMACGDYNCSQVIFNVGCISKFVYGEADNPMDLNVLFEILRRFLAREPYIGSVESPSQNVQVLKTSWIYGEKFLEDNTAIIDKGIQSGSDMLPIHQRPERHIPNSKSAPFWRTTLITLLRQITKAEEYYTQGSFVAAAMELSSAAAAVLDFSPDKRSYQRSLDREVVKLSRYIILHYAEAVPQELPFTIRHLMYLFRRQDLLESAEVMIRQLISHTPPADSRKLITYDKNLFEVLQKARSRSGRIFVVEESSQEFVRLWAAILAGSLVNRPLHIECNVLTLNLVVESLHGTWARYCSNTHEEDTDQYAKQNGLRQEIEALLFDLTVMFRDKGQTSQYGPKVATLARSFSLLGWYDTSNHLFFAATRCRATTDSIQIFTWQALNLLQQGLWQAAVEPMRKAYDSLQDWCRSMQFAEFKNFALPLHSALKDFPPGMTEAPSIQYMSNKLDEWLANPETWRTRWISAVGLSELRKTTLHSSIGSSYSNTVNSSSSAWTSSSSRYGVTYSEGGLSDISHNYSALFG